MLINLNCELDTNFLADLVASYLSVEVVDVFSRYFVRLAKMSQYARALMTQDRGDRFYLQLFCHSGGWSDFQSVSCIESVYESIRSVRFPSHSYAFLWATDSKNFWDNPSNRHPADFTQIYARWDNHSREVTLPMRGIDLTKWCCSDLQYSPNFEQKLSTLEWKRLNFGRNSIRHLRMGGIKPKEPQDTEDHTKIFVKLHDPQDTNISFILEVGDRPIRPYSDPWESVSSYHDTVLVTRVPSIEKNAQIARTILHVELWLPLTSMALAAAIVLKYTKEGFGTCFFRLVHSVSCTQ